MGEGIGGVGVGVPLTHIPSWTHFKRGWADLHVVEVLEKIVQFSGRQGQEAGSGLIGCAIHTHHCQNLEDKIVRLSSGQLGN